MGYHYAMSSLLKPLVDRIRAIPPAQWEDLARMAGCAKTLPRKLACGDRSNPRVRTIQPLVDYFDRVDRGESPLPRGQLPSTTRDAPHAA